MMFCSALVMVTRRRIAERARDQCRPCREGLGRFRVICNHQVNWTKPCILAIVDSEECGLKILSVCTSWLMIKSGN